MRVKLLAHISKRVCLYFGHTGPSDIHLRRRVRIDELEVVSVGIDFELGVVNRPCDDPSKSL